MAKKCVVQSKSGQTGWRHLRNLRNFGCNGGYTMKTARRELALVIFQYGKIRSFLAFTLFYNKSTVTHPKFEYNFQFFLKKNVR